MVTADVITGYLNSIVLALTPIQRWDAARRFNSSFMAERLFILIGIIAIITLTALLFIASFNRNRREQKGSESLFVEYAEKRGLTIRECDILIDIAQKSGMKRKESVFNLRTAFDRGATQMMEESLAGQEITKESRQLETEMFFLREKLGFQKRVSSQVPGDTKTKSQRLSTKQIPVSRELTITSREKDDTIEFKATVIENDNNGLSVKPETPTELTVGQLLCVRYYFGSSVWEFDASVISNDDGIVVLKHSYNIRFINRRRFLRVPVRKPAFIAIFPFKKELKNNIEDETENEIKEGEMAQDLPELILRPPEFVPAVVTELGGPGLRIEAAIEVKSGDRVLIMFESDVEKERNSTGDSGSNEVTTALKIIEDIGVVEEIGEVKGVRNAGGIVSLGIELISLTDANINELIRATNAASLNVGDKNKNVSVSGGAVEHIQEHAGT